MRILYRFVVGGFLALVVGMTVGLIRDDVQMIIAPDSDSTGAPLKRFVDESTDLPSRGDTAFKAKEVECLANIIFREARDQSVGIRRLTAIVTIARRDDTDPQWPKTICGIMVQKGQISGVDQELVLNPDALRTLDQSHRIAEEVYEGAWKTQLLPHGWECVRYWRISDEKLAAMKTKHLRQLGIDKQFKGLGFFDKLEAVPTPPEQSPSIAIPIAVGSRSRRPEHSVLSSQLNRGP